MNYENVDGIAFLKEGQYICTKPRKLIENIDEIPYPAWHLFNIDYYALLRSPNIGKTERSFPIIRKGLPF